MTLGDKIAGASLIVGILGTAAAWLVVPGVFTREGVQSEQMRAVMPIPSNSARQISSPLSSTQQSVKLTAQYTVQFGSCTRNRAPRNNDHGSDVTCTAFITNDAQEDGHATLICQVVNDVPMATFVDSEGVTYRARRCALAGIESSYTNSVRLASRVRYRIDVVYEDVASSVASASLVEFRIGDEQRLTYPIREESVRFTDVPIAD